MENKKFDWNKRIGHSDKGTSDYVNPFLSWGLFAGALALSVILAFIII